MSQRLAILLSAGLNAALAVVLVWLPRPATGTSAGAAADATKPVNSPGNTATKRPKSVKPVATNAQSHTLAAAPEAAFHWRQVESEDYRHYIANLRAIGCPEQTIRDLIIADVNKLYAPRLLALNQPAEPRQYWQIEPRWSAQTYERERQRDAIRKEKQALLRELLGIEYDEGAAWRSLNGWRGPDSILSFLAPEKVATIRALEERYSALGEEIDRRSRNLYEPEDDRDSLKLRLQMRAEMAKLLTPQELEEYELRSSDTASQMRWEMREFAPTPDEFRNVFRLHAEVERSGQLIYDGAAPPEEKARYTEAEKQLQASLKTVLGDSRYTAYQRSQDYEFQQLSRAGERYELSRETANQVWDLREAADRQAKALNTNPNLAPEQRQAALKAIQAETEKSVKTILGERGWKGYSPRASNWLQRLGTLTSEP